MSLSPTGTPTDHLQVRFGAFFFFIAWYRTDHPHVAFRATFSFHTLLSLSPIMPTSLLPPIQFPLPLRGGKSPTLRHFRDVTLTRRGNNAVADDCCAGRHLGSNIMQRRVSACLRWPAENFLSDRLAELPVEFCLFSVPLSVERFISRSVTMFVAGSSVSIANNWTLFSFTCAFEQLVIRRQCRSCKLGIQNNRFIDRMPKHVQFRGAVMRGI